MTPEKRILRIKNVLKKGFIAILLISVSSIFPKDQKIYNSLNEINARSEKVKLTLLREWGGDEIQDKELAFYHPTDVKISPKGLVYICDSFNNRIQIFDEKMNFVMTIGKRGEGPGDLIFPTSMALDIQGNLYIADFSNSRIQIFNSEGRYQNSFKTEGKPSAIALTKNNDIVVWSVEKAFKTKKMLTIYHKNGEKIKEICQYPHHEQFIQHMEDIYFDIDDSDNVYIAFYGTPLIRKYDISGQLLMEILFEMPFKIRTPKKIVSNKEIGVIRDRVSAGLKVDAFGRIWLVSTMRPYKKEEEKIYTSFAVSKKGTIIPVKLPRNIEKANNIDLYRILIFDRFGKIIASKRIDIYCDNLYVSNNKVFLIDTFAGMKILEYKFDIFQ